MKAKGAVEACIDHMLWHMVVFSSLHAFGTMQLEHSAKCDAADGQCMSCHELRLRACTLLQLHVPDDVPSVADLGLGKQVHRG